MPAAMTPAPPTIRCRVPLLRPAEPADATWSFLLLPAPASAPLPSRGLVTVAGHLAGHPFVATLQPDGQGSHWLKVAAALREAAGLAVGERVDLVCAPVREEPEPEVPDDVHAALAAHADAQAQWRTLTPVQRRDWVHWITSGKQAATRVKRIASACDMLASGKRRACCFDSSGRFSRSLSAPRAAEGQPSPRR